jgi:hypothetical protein
MTSCLYRSDYGPPEPGFDPLAAARSAACPRHFDAFAGAQNAGQFAAVKRKLDRGESVIWCDQGYSWTYAPVLDAAFVLAMLFLALPVAVLRAGAKRGRLLAKVSRHARPATRPR